MRRANVSRDDMHRLLLMTCEKATTSKGVALAVDDMCTEGGTVPLTTSSIPTFENFAKDWTSGKLHERFQSREPEERRQRRGRPSTSEKVRARTRRRDAARRLASRTLRARHVTSAAREEPDDAASHRASVPESVMTYATYPAKHIATNPIPARWLPKKAKPKAKAYLWPREDAALLSCVAIPIERRVLYGVLARRNARW